MSKSETLNEQTTEQKPRLSETENTDTICGIPPADDAQALSPFEKKELTEDEVNDISGGFFIDSTHSDEKEKRRLKPVAGIPQ